MQTACLKIVTQGPARCFKNYYSFHGVWPTVGCPKNYPILVTTKNIMRIVSSSYNLKCPWMARNTLRLLCQGAPWKLLAEAEESELPLIDAQRKLWKKCHSPMKMAIVCGTYV